LSWHPRAFYFHAFVTEEEANQLIVEAAPQMKRSTVVGEKSGVVDEIRTSYGTFLGRLSSPAIEKLEKRLANWTQLPIVHQEDVQVIYLVSEIAYVWFLSAYNMLLLCRYCDTSTGKNMGLTMTH
jgi:hypothetical protein